MSSKRCPCCRRILTPGDPPHCRPCNTPTRNELDERGHVVRSWNHREQIVFQARANYRLDEVGPQRARADYASPLDAWQPSGVARIAQLKPRPEPT